MDGDVVVIGVGVLMLSSVTFTFIYYRFYMRRK